MKLLAAFFLFPMGAYAQIRIDSYGDSLKGNVKSMTQYSVSTKSSGVTGYVKPDTTKCIYTCDVAKGTELIRFYNEHDKETSHEVIQFDGKGHVLEQRYYTDLDSLYMKCTYAYEVHGWETKNCRVNYPFHASYPKEEQEVSTSFKDSLGSYTTYTYDNVGHVTERVDQSSVDAYITTDEIMAYKYDLKGNKTEEYDLNVRACGQENYVLFYFDGRGYTKKTLFKYDSRGRVAERMEYTERKKPSSFMNDQQRGTSIGMKHHYTYSGEDDIADNDTMMQLYRESDNSITTGKPTTITPWVDRNKAIKEYDKQGNVVKKIQYNMLVYTRTIAYF